MNADRAGKLASLEDSQINRSKRLQILMAVAIGTFMGPLDSSVVNVALPSLSNYFHVSLAVVEWVVIAYLLIISSLLLTYGRLGDLYGHKRVYISGFIIFTFGSLLCGTAASINLLIIFRAVQALGAGMLMAMGPALVTVHTPPQERGKALGIIAVAVSVALTTGPVLGGFLTTHFGWQSIFLINLPIGLIGSLWAYKVIPASQGHEVQPFDIKGAVLLFLALISLLFPLSYAEKVGWQHYYIWGLLVAGIVLAALFLIQEKRTKHPMLDLSLFKNRLFAMGNLSSLLSYMAQFSIILIMPFYLQKILQFPPSKAGLLLIPMPLMTMVIAPISGSISDRIDTRYLSALGMGITSLGLWLLSNLTEHSSVLNIVLALMINGLGVGMFQTPNNSAIMGTVPGNRRGIASSVLATMRNLGMVVGVAVSGAVFSSHQSYLTKTLAAQGLTGKQLTIQAFTGALHLTYSVGAILAFVAVLTSLVRGSSKPMP